MAMTGGTAKLVYTGYGGGSKSFPIKVYVYYKTSQSTADNKSTITCGMYVTTPSGWDIGSWQEFVSSYVGTTSLTFDGAIPNFSGTRWLAENKKFTVTHNADGTGKATIKWKWGVRSTWADIYEISGSFDITLPTIARASIPTVSASSVQMKKELTITTNRKSSSFTHTLKYKFGDATGTIATGVGASYKWTVPDLAAKCNNALSGKCTITCITYSGSTKVGEKTVDVTLTVPTASVPTASSSSVAMGKNVTIYTNRKSSNFTHKLTYSFGGASGTIGEDITTSKSWLVSLNLAKQIKSDTKGTCTVTCTTYNGTAKVGTNTVVFTATVPENDTTRPKLSAFSITPTGDYPDAFSGLYIQGKTGVKATFTASSTYSSIASYKLTADGRNYTGNPTASLPFSRDGNFTVTGTVTDNRGFSSTKKELDINVIPYRNPSIEPCEGDPSIICERSLQDGTYDDAGTYLHIKCKRKYSPVVADGVQRNFCDLLYQYKVAGGSWTSSATLLDGADTTTDEYEGKLPNIVSQTDKSYTVRLIVRDTLGAIDGVAETYEFAIATADVTLHMGQGGYGVAVGKYSEATPDNKMFEVAEDWDLVLGGKAVVDSVTEQGTSGIWSYRLWKSGKCELYGYHKATLAVKTASGNVYRSESIAVNFPFRVYDMISIVDCNDFNAWASAITPRAEAGNPTISYVLWRGATYDATDWYTHIYISGRWK